MFTSRKRGFDSSRRSKLFRCCELLILLLHLCSNCGTEELCPFWDSTTSTIYFVDYDPPKLRSYHPANDSYGVVDIALQGGESIDQVTFAIPIANSDSLLAVGMGQRIGIFQWDGRTDKPIQSKSVFHLDNTKGVSIKTAATDTKGLLWVVSLDKVLSGSLISVDANGTVSAPIELPGVGYGLAFTATNLYYTNSGTKVVTGYDYDSASKTFSNNKTVFDMGAHSLNGLPMGLTVDKEGNLWVACTHYILGIEPSGNLLAQLELPVKNTDYIIASVVLGGSAVDALYASTVSSTPSEISALVLIHHPNITIVGVPGVRAVLSIPPS